MKEKGLWVLVSGFEDKEGVSKKTLPHESYGSLKHRSGRRVLSQSAFINVFPMCALFTEDSLNNTFIKKTFYQISGE